MDVERDELRPDGVAAEEEELQEEDPDILEISGPVPGPRKRPRFAVVMAAAAARRVKQEVEQEPVSDEEPAAAQEEVELEPVSDEEPAAAQEESFAEGLEDESEPEDAELLGDDDVAPDGLVDDETEDLQAEDAPRQAPVLWNFLESGHGPLRKAQKKLEALMNAGGLAWRTMMAYFLEDEAEDAAEEAADTDDRLPDDTVARFRVQIVRISFWFGKETRGFWFAAKPCLVVATLKSSAFPFGLDRKLDSGVLPPNFQEKQTLLKVC